MLVAVSRLPVEVQQRHLAARENALEPKVMLDDLASAEALELVGTVLEPLIRGAPGCVCELGDRLAVDVVELGPAPKPFARFREVFPDATEDWGPGVLLKLGPPIRADGTRSGKLRDRRAWADIDLLFTSATVEEAAKLTKLRDARAAED